MTYADQHGRPVRQRQTPADTLYTPFGTAEVVALSQKPLADPA